MPSLADLSTQWEQLEQELECSGGVATPAVEATLGELLGAEADKADGYALVIAGLNLKSDHAAVRRSEAEAQMWATPEGRLVLQLEQTEERSARHADWLLARMEDYMVARNLDVVKGHIYRFQFEKHGGKTPLEITVPVEEIPPRYHRVEITPDKEALRVALEGGAVIPGVTLGERGRSLRIR